MNNQSRDYLNFNQARWNDVSSNEKNDFTIPLTHDEFIAAKDQPMELYLTIGQAVPQSWFEKAVGKKILGLACGGGQQGPLFALNGYNVTIMDYSEAQLSKDQMVAERENLQIQTVQADMTQTFPFEDESFDIIFCPVSNTYIEDLDNMWRECYRVLRKGGLLMVGYMNPWVYMVDLDYSEESGQPPIIENSIPYNSRHLEQEGKVKIDPDYGYEFSHTLETQIRGQLKNGFAMIDFYESKDPNNPLSKFSSDYLANLSVKW